MYTAVMEYHFKPEYFAQACQIWQEEIMDLAQQQPGFVRMQFLTREKEYALAIGTWQAAEDAQAFMRTGIFIKLLEKFSEMLVAKPTPQIWQTQYYAEK
jgi:hypothetical protein